MRPPRRIRLPRHRQAPMGADLAAPRLGLPLPRLRCCSRSRHVERWCWRRLRCSSTCARYMCRRCSNVHSSSRKASCSSWISPCMPVRMSLSSAMARVEAPHDSSTLSNSSCMAVISSTSRRSSSRNRRSSAMMAPAPLPPPSSCAKASASRTMATTSSVASASASRRGASALPASETCASEGGHPLLLAGNTAGATSANVSADAASNASNWSN
mmetsp:Transcript_56791/g.164483  ORF Transcript_56791/g.164483 Transcript_56791/m.164483 type:complete len:214 (-) Transcript_56791:1333-1974(-)